MANFKGWTFIWTFLGFLCILASVSIDSWTSNSFPQGKFFTGTPSEASVMRQDWGTLGLTYSGRDGYGYKLLCPAGDRDQENATNPIPNEIGAKAKGLNETSSGMIFMLLMANIFGFVASFFAVLPASGSHLVTSLKNASFLAPVAALMCLITWALWLRAQYEWLKPNNLFNSCRFERAPGINVHVGASFALAILANFFYVLLFLHVKKVVKVYGEADPMQEHTKTVLYAVIGFACIFVASIYNEWSHAGMEKFGEYYGMLWANAAQESFIDRFPTPRYDSPTDGFGIIYRTFSNGLAHVEYRNIFGIYTAYQTIEVSMPYNDIQNRAFFCKLDLEADFAGPGLVQGGRIALGFAIAAVIFSSIAAYKQSIPDPKGFYFSCVAFCSGIVSIFVWGIISDFIIRSRCCDESWCSLGQSYALMAVGCFFLFIATFYQGWVIADDVYVLHPTVGYSAKPGLEENLASNTI